MWMFWWILMASVSLITLVCWYDGHCLFPLDTATRPLGYISLWHDAINKLSLKFLVSLAKTDFIIRVSVIHRSRVYKSIRYRHRNTKSKTNIKYRLKKLSLLQSHGQSFKSYSNYVDLLSSQLGLPCPVDRAELSHAILSSWPLDTWDWDL